MRVYFQSPQGQKGNSGLNGPAAYYTREGCRHRLTVLAAVLVILAFAFFLWMVILFVFAA